MKIIIRGLLAITASALALPGIAEPSRAVSARLPATQSVEEAPGLDRKHQVIELEELVVTGTRLKRTVEEGPSPVVIIDRERIDALGASTIPDVLKHVAQQPYGREEGFLSNGAQFVELRGLGVDTTLVLIDGRRVVPSAPNVASNAFDLNAIPLSAVERIEVLSDSASAVYGADAMGGVVNILLKKEVPRPVIDLSYGSSDGGADESRLSVSAGLSGERARGSIVLDYFDRDQLPGRERELWLNQDFTRFGSIDNRSLNANPGNVTSRTAANLPGLDSRFAAVPSGSSGIDLSPADFVGTAGQRNRESLMRWWSVVPHTKRRSALAFGEIDIKDDLQLFAQYLFADRDTHSESDPPAISNLRVPAANAFNPFGVDVNANFLLTGIGPRRTVVEVDLERLTAGVRGDLGAWDWEIAAVRSDENASSLTRNNVDPTRVTAALGATDPNEALNVFQDGPGGSPALLRSLVATPIVNEYESSGTQVSAFVRGDVIALPAGALQFIAGGEWRKEEFLFKDFLFVAHDRHVSAAFAEMEVPLVARSRIPFLHKLGLVFAVRNDHYSDFGDTLNPQYGLTWMPAESLTVRASYGTSFRPPSLFELYAPRTSVPFSVADPRRGGEVASATLISGGNPNLDPLEAESLTAGFVWSPEAWAPLRMYASYWQIDLQDRVSSFSPLLVLANEGRFPERVRRGDPTPADILAGRAGPIITIDSSRLNFGSIETSGVDVGVSVEFESAIGRFAPNITATWVGSYEASDLPNAPAQQRVGVAYIFGTIPKWRVAGSVGWSHRGVGASLTARYFPQYDDATFVTGRTGRSVSSQTLMDAQVSFDIGERSRSESWLAGVRLAAGVNNVLDSEPPFSEINGPAGYDRSQGDLKQRFGYVKLSKSF